MAVVLEYERRRRYPVLFFEKIHGYDIPVVCNVVASRRALAFAVGVPESELAGEYARRIRDPMKPVVVADPPFRRHVATGDAVDLASLPIPVYFPGDAGRYITAGTLVGGGPHMGGGGTGDPPREQDGSAPMWRRPPPRPPHVT